jgi:ABC-type Mn2+/Zn2+ transport system permease subunit
LLVMLALAIVAGIQAVGVVMTTALMVTPAAAASLITTRLRGMFVWSGVLSVVSNFIGLYVSYYLAVSSGSAIVLSCTVLFGFIVTHAWRLSRYSSNVR